MFLSIDNYNLSVERFQQKFSQEREKMNQRIKEIRLKNNLNKKNFADSIGLSSSAMTYIENGSKIPSTETIIKICQKYNISADYILFGKTLQEKDIFENLNKTEKDIVTYIIETANKRNDPMVRMEKEKDIFENLNETEKEIVNNIIEKANEREKTIKKAGNL